MRKFLPVLFIILFFSGCAQSNNYASKDIKILDKKNSTVSTKLSISDIFPFKKNVQLKYTSSEGPNSYSSIYIDFIKNDRMQFRLVSSDTSIGYVVENKDGELRFITSRNSFYYTDDLTSVQNVNPEIMLKEPLIKGTTWTLPNGSKRYISNDNIQIATASGKYIALEITTETDKGKTLNYYAPNVGLVKTISDSANKNITSLESIVTDAIATETVKFYYPNSSMNSLMFIKRQLHFNTDDLAKTYFEKYFKESPSSTLSPVISQTTMINKLYLNNDENKVYVDFSKELIKESNLSNNEEANVLKCITNTLCEYFNVDKLSLTVEGNPYESGHIIMKATEPLYIDNKNIDEFK
ncbi:MAG: GerMN domain-containing protein [Clostridiaceae bacterium]|nr:GerMN domain-containing protein [Clostridiaceae bacterium]